MTASTDQMPLASHSLSAASSSFVFELSLPRYWQKD